MTVAILLLGAHTTPALAHAERSASSPREGATSATAPEVLRLTFTEPPTGDANVAVLDGCKRDVVADVEVQNFEITATLETGQPGRWSVQTNVISAIDGHNTRDRWTFDVRGEADCSAPETDLPDGAADDDDDGDSRSSVPLLLLGGGTLALLVLGLMLRGRGG